MTKISFINDKNNLTQNNCVNKNHFQNLLFGNISDFDIHNIFFNFEIFYPKYIFNFVFHIFFLELYFFIFEFYLLFWIFKSGIKIVLEFCKNDRVRSKLIWYIKKLPLCFYLYCFFLLNLYFFIKIFFSVPINFLHVPHQFQNLIFKI